MLIMRLSPDLSVRGDGFPKTASPSSLAGQLLVRLRQWGTGS